MNIKITNTLTGNKEDFTPQHSGKVSMYVCGVTPYDDAHVGHGRCYVTFDTVYRLLNFLGYSVTYCRNLTDIDDKILRKAEHEYGSVDKYAQVTDKFIARYQEDMKKLNCQSPTVEPRVTDNMPAIIAFIEGLITAGKAYVAAGDVYYAIESFPEYGKLSKQRLDDLQAGARVEVNEKKRNVLDFALWKSEPEGRFWKAPWGYGRPGWHIECSALAKKYLSDHIDLHAGGMDLIFPHHENEIAQSEGLYGAPFARYWMHNAFVQVKKEKMSKSLGNFFTLRDVFEQFDPMVIRYYILTHHYRAPLDFAFDDIKGVEKSYRRLCTLFAASQEAAPTHQEVMASPLVAAMLNFLTDDINTVGMLGVLFENIDILRTNADERACVKAFLQQILGLTLQPLPEKTVEITPEIQALLDEREQARLTKNWVRADELRAQLTEMGVDLKDKKS